MSARGGQATEIGPGLIISGFKPPERQMAFWSPPLRNHAHIRNFLGEIAEEATAHITGGRRHKTDSRADYCPDVSAGKLYFECKAAGCSNQTFVYQGRLAKDVVFASERSLIYAVWHHAVKTLELQTVDELREQFYATLKGVYFVPFAEFNRICMGLNLEKLNSKYGPAHTRGGEATYGAGYRVPIKALAPWRINPW
jgi:hypothetical protein